MASAPLLVRAAAWAGTAAAHTHTHASTVATRTRGVRQWSGALLWLWPVASCVRSSVLPWPPSHGGMTAVCSGAVPAGGRGWRRARCSGCAGLCMTTGHGVACVHRAQCSAAATASVLPWPQGAVPAGGRGWWLSLSLSLSLPLSLYLIVRHSVPSFVLFRSVVLSVVRCTWVLSSFVCVVLSVCLSLCFFVSLFSSLFTPVLFLQFHFFL